MQQGNIIEFVVDEQYENEKGVFTVLSIHKEEMVIRWENGEELRTDIELQRNIQARRQWEVLQKEKEAQAAKNSKKSAAAKSAAAFDGFKDTDFKNSASGTKWRGRAQLGGTVTVKLPDGRYHFNSWAFANKPEMHWLDTEHQKRRSGDHAAKFFVRVNSEEMIFGFSVGQPKDDADRSDNWDALLDWLQQEDNGRRVHSIATKNDIIICDRNRPADGVYSPVEGGWKGNADSETIDADKLSDVLGTLTSQGPVSLEVSKTIKKQDVLSSGKNIAVDVSELFTELIALYRASWMPAR